MTIKIKELEEILFKIAFKHVSPDEASYFTRVHMDAYIRKYPHIDVVKDVLVDFKKWKESSHAKIDIVSDKPGALLYNFNGLSPSLKIKSIHDELEKRAKANGIAMIGMNNSGGLHAISIWTNTLVERGLIGLCFFNGGPSAVVPYGGTKGIMGANPLSYSIPTQTDPILLDMATSEIFFLDLLNAIRDNTALQVGAAVDGDGVPTTNPHDVLDKNEIANLLPMGGGYKGYGICLLAEILTGPLVGACLSTEMSPATTYVSEEHGALLIGIDISSFVDLRKFKASVSGMSDIIRSQRPAPGIDRVTVPGDRGQKNLDQAMEVGEVEVDQKVFTELRSYL